MASYQREISIPGKTADEIYSRISKAIDQFLANDSGKFGKFDVQCDPGSKTIRLKSAQVSADLQCEDGAVQLAGKLSFLASAFRPKIDGYIDQWIAKSFKA